MFVFGLGTDCVKNSCYSLQRTASECIGKAVIESGYELIMISSS